MSSLKEKTGCIYIHTNIISGKSYIGLTTTGIKKRWNAHIAHASKGTQTYFYNAIRKYGKDTWVSAILEDYIKQSDLNNREVYWIAKYNTYGKGYNSTPGGDSSAITHYRKPWSDERRKVQMQAIADRGHVPMPDEQKQKLREANLGKTASGETKTKMSSAQIGIKGSSFKPWWYMNPDGIFVEMFDITKKDFSVMMGWPPRILGGPTQCMHGNVLTQGARKGWAFGNGLLTELEYVSNVNKPKRKSPTTKGKPRDTSFNNKAVGQYDKDTNMLIQTFVSGKEASVVTGVNYNSITRCVNGGRRLASGFVWKSMV